MAGQSAGSSVLELTADIVSAYLKNNRAGANSIPQLIQQVHQTLATLAPDAVAESGTAAAPLARSRPEPAVPITKSVFDDYIICLEDGRKLRTLKRHLRTAYNLTPDQYRRRWELGPDYPMVAPSYARQRSDLAKRIGLGQKRLDD